MVETKKRISESKEKAWRDYLQTNGSPDGTSRKLRENWVNYNKRNFPVLIRKIKRSTLWSASVDDNTIDKSYGEIDFANISGWTDHLPFKDVVDGKYVNNEFSISVGLCEPMGGGSAIYGFKWSETNANRISRLLKEHEYLTQIIRVD